MKIHLFPFLVMMLGLFSDTSLYAQELRFVPPVVRESGQSYCEGIDDPEIRALYPFGQDSLIGYLQASTKTSEKLWDAYMTDVSFVVTETGVICGAKSSRLTLGSECASCDSLAVSIVTSMPDWIPARNGKGENIPSRKTITLIFKPDKLVDPVTPVPEPVLVQNDIPAEFPGGAAALRQYLSENLVYPATAEQQGIEGKSYLKFVVSTDGTIRDVKVFKGVPGCTECDREAVRLVEAMPRWTPGTYNGKVSDSMYTLPILFKLD